MVDVYLNGRIVGSADSPKRFVKKIKELRRKGVIDQEINISFNEKNDLVVINTEKGRARRPLINVKNGKPELTSEHIKKIKNGLLTWNDLIREGIIEYLDAEEEENCLIAVDQKELTEEHTHLELAPFVIFGPQAMMVPFSEHNSSVRVTYGSKLIKQGLGVYLTNYNIRNDTDVNILHYPQKPIVSTAIYGPINYNRHPIGQNIVVAIMSWEGYNMEDAVILNKSSVERGLYRSTHYRPYKSEQLKYPGGIIDVIELPNKDVSGYRSENDYKYLESDGIVYPEANVESDNVLIGKTSPPRFLASLEEFRVGVQARRETSVAVRHGEKGVVDSVIISESEEGNKFVKIKLREQRIPEIGDKFSSRHGQKGIVGMTVPQEDMPYTVSGVIPDLIFSPHGIPSRMTVGHLLELMGGKVGALTGKQVDGTAFDNMSEEELKKTLLEYGFRDNGSETLYNGMTGKIYNARIFVGNIYYLKLVHMVAGKMHARSRGPVQLLTRQPTEGRSKEGGLRLGEMEKDCFVAHGAALLLKERFDSDKAVIPVCKNCGLVAIYNRMRNKGVCSICGEDAPVTFVEMSYTFKILLDELKAMHIYPKISVDQKS